MKPRFKYSTRNIFNDSEQARSWNSLSNLQKTVLSEITVRESLKKEFGWDDEYFEFEWSTGNCTVYFNGDYFVSEQSPELQLTALLGEFEFYKGNRDWKQLKLLRRGIRKLVKQIEDNSREECSKYYKRRAEIEDEIREKCEEERRERNHAESEQRRKLALEKLLNDLKQKYPNAFVGRILGEYFEVLGAWVCIDGEVKKFKFEEK